ncbi:MAG TPA: acetate--CoA ligase family protein [Albitalea sp.]|uniref:acetate--CoA ligase family protein n=1 Tax=Piscinibacter sp. TaxID=1903157 RepID=UPI002ED1B150
MSRRANLQRLLAPRHVAVFGGRPAAEVVRQCRRVGFEGEIWPVHPRHDSVEGLRCWRSVADLPAPPDASFIALPREASIEVVAALAQRGAGGAVCHASGFAEVGGEGVALQARLVQAAGEMALIGPNCYGVLNCLDGAALWPDQHGGRRVARGVAIVAQSGDIAINLTMQRRALPIACVVSMGNQAGTRLADVVDGLLDDSRITAIGLHIEGLGDVGAFSRVALRALEQGVGLVAMKCGSSSVGAQIALSHTSSLAGADALCDALLRRLGVARVHEPAALVETLKLLHVHDALAGPRIATASCSGGQATLAADLAEARALRMPPLPEGPRTRLQSLLGDKVNVTNPLDYHTYIWGDLAAQAACFAALMESRFDLHCLLLDLPRDDRCDPAGWHTALDAFAQAGRRTGAATAVVSSLPEGLPEAAALRLLEAGVAPMHGLAHAMEAVAASAAIGAARARRDRLLPVESPLPAEGEARLLDEWTSKQALAAFGVPVPRGESAVLAEAVDCADAIGYPVVVKAVSADIAHKTEAGAVHLNLKSADEVRNAVRRLGGLSDRVLVEAMQADVVAEVIVGVQRDPQFGLALTVGAGGVLVELLQDAATLLLPVTRDDIRAALRALRIWPLLEGHRGRPGGDMEALLDAIEAIASFARHHADRLRELDVNPLLVLPRGVVAVDALIRM